MAGIGEDIRDVLQELGTPFTIVKLDGSIILGEYLDYEMYFEQSTEFIRQFCYSGDFQFDTQIAQGDLIQFDNKNFLMMNVKKTLFENEVVDFSNFFIECPSLGTFSRFGETRDPVSRALTTTWTTLHDSVPGTMTVKSQAVDRLSGMETRNDRYRLFTQGFTDIRVGDRWYPDRSVLTEYYQINAVDRFRFIGLLAISLIEDSRE